MSLIKPNSAEPMVSIAMITFNHEAFIAQAIESVLMQQGGFDFELIIGEDCSADGTREIVREYRNRFPRRIHLLLPDSNQGMIPNLVATLHSCRGRYVALLEGDDYWTDPLKLKLQVDFLENNPKYSMCCTNFSVVDATGRILSREGWWGKKELELTHAEILRANPPKTLTTMFRRSALPDAFPKEFYQVLNGDGFLFALISKQGSAAFLDVITGCARRHSQGVWSPLNAVQQCEAQLNTYTLMRHCFVEPYEQKALHARIYNILVQLLSLYMMESDTTKLSEIAKRLKDYRSDLVLIAWAHAIRHASIHHLKASSIGQRARALHFIRKLQV